jgi:hypothetical protein
MAKKKAKQTVATPLGWAKRPADEDLEWKNLSSPFDGGGLPASLANVYADAKLLVANMQALNDDLFEGTVISDDVATAVLTQRGLCIMDCAYELFRLTMRLSESRPLLDAFDPGYRDIPEFGGIVGKTYFEIAVKIGMKIQRWLKKAVDWDLEKSLTRLPIEDQAWRMAQCVEERASLFVADWRPMQIDWDRLEELLEVESRRAAKVHNENTSRCTVTTTDQDRWKFARPLREKTPQIKWRIIAELYQKQTGEPVDEQSMKQSCHRASRP